MTRRDTYIVTVIAVLGAVAAFWFLALAPKREKLAAVDKDVAEARQVLDQARQEKIKFARAQIAFPRLYASLGRLGKAVPVEEDVPSLLVQLNHAAAQADVNFHSVELKRDLAEKAEQEAASATPAAPAGAEGTAAPAGGESAEATPPAAGASTAPPAAGASGAAGAAAPAAAAPAADPTAATPAPTGGFKLLPFEYRFKGDFFDLEDLIHNMTALVERRNQEFAVTGRLITIEGFTMKRGDITVLATTYMLPADQGLFAGATPQGPAGAAAPQAAAAGSAAPTPPTAAVTSP
jgi:type II secretory pathway pseudopilin PulG